jgi:hypothetical protein
MTPAVPFTGLLLVRFTVITSNFMCIYTIQNQYFHNLQTKIPEFLLRNNEITQSAAHSLLSPAALEIIPWKVHNFDKKKRKSTLFTARQLQAKSDTINNSLHFYPADTPVNIRLWSTYVHAAYIGVQLENWSFPLFREIDIYTKK